MPFFPTDIENKSIKPLALDLNKHLVSNTPSTFFAEVEDRGDIIIIDKSIEPTHNSMVISYIDGEFRLKRFEIKNNIAYLTAENNKDILVDNNNNIWGVVTYYINKM